MKATSHIKSAVTCIKWILYCTLLVGALGIGLTKDVTSGTGTQKSESHESSTCRVIPPDVRFHCLSYGEWGAQWWRWAYSFSLAEFPPSQSGEVDCSAGQSGPVWFLAGTTGQGPVTRECSDAIPKGKALFFPIITYLNDYPCPDPNFQPPPGQNLEQFLTEGAAAIIDLVTQLEVTVDGHSLHDLFSYRTTSQLFTFMADPSLVGFDACVTGDPQFPQFGVTDGYSILLTPLPSGPHTIFIHGVIDFGGGNTFEVQVTYNFTVAS